MTYETWTVKRFPFLPIRMQKPAPAIMGLRKISRHTLSNLANLENKAIGYVITGFAAIVPLHDLLLLRLPG